MLQSQLALTPPGAFDLTGAAARRRRELQRASMGVLERAGYEELIPPTLEYQETFLRAGGAGVAERLIRFPDRDGRILALRYDFTASLARVAATTFAGGACPLRLCYSGTVYRQEPERGGRPREMLQVGAELLGQADLAADIEIVQLTIALLRAAGIRDFQINLGHVGVLAPGLAAVAEDVRAEVRRWIDRKDRGSLCRTLADAQGAAASLTVLPFVIGRRDALSRAHGAFRPPDAGRGPLTRSRHHRGSAAVTRLRVALAKGRLYEPSVERFARAGAAPAADAGRRLLIPSSDPAIEFLVVKPGDVPVYVESGAADLGVTGTDVLRESGADVLEPLELGFGFCRLSVAAPADAPYPALPGGITARVATKYPRLAQAHFRAAGRPVDIIQVNGSVEVAPLLNLSHWIVDLVDTGNTLRANGLVERETVLQCGAILVANRAAQKLKLEAYLDLMERLERTIGR